MATPVSELNPIPGTDPVSHTWALIRPWIDYVPQQQRRLGLFICLALVLHVATFFFVRIDATRAELRPAVRVHVTMEASPVVSPETDTDDVFWDRLTDPRLFLLPQQPLSSLSSDVPALDFGTINSGIDAGQLPAPASAGVYEFIHPINPPLAERVQEAMTPARQPFVYNERPSPPATRTTWEMDASLVQRLPQMIPSLPSPLSDTNLNPTELRVGVGADGTVEHVLLEQSCQKPELDQLAILAARKIRFQRVDQPGLVWGRVTVSWFYAAKPVEEVVPAPPSGG